MELTKEEEMALQQFEGFRIGKKERTVIELIEAMALTKKEWERIKRGRVVLLDKEDKREIDNYFKGGSI